MNELNNNNSFPDISGRQPDKIETYAGKYTARVTKIYNGADGFQYSFTQRINKDGTLTKKMEQRHR